MDPMDIDQIVAFNDEDVGIDPAQVQISMVGRLFSPRPLTRATMERVANGMWGTSAQSITIHEADRGL
ncbi:unnamed protein product [Linum trigynum]|uniref:Uncharacterized protein n=1 Tax=Linum trigynum TaxID=586398 RepID=A0AAV2FUE8_9ROSI